MDQAQPPAAALRHLLAKTEAMVGKDRLHMKPLQEQIADIIGAPPVTSMDGAAAVMKLIQL